MAEVHCSLSGACTCEPSVDPVSPEAARKWQTAESKFGAHVCTCMQVPLFAVKPKGPAGVLLNKQLAGGQTPASAPVMGGTPRYLQLRCVVERLDICGHGAQILHGHMPLAYPGCCAECKP